MDSIDVYKKAEKIIKEHDYLNKLSEKCIKAGICETCGEELSTEFIKEYSEVKRVKYKSNGLFRKKSKVVSISYKPALRIYCKHGHQEHIAESCNWDKYSETLNENILKGLAKLTYIYDDDDFDGFI